ncbi:S8/S53 family peptidase [Aureitalea marina]|uniref:Peptidase S8 n=1 Tax=Aureitalea marina TaxID=930804 RepID=A0A2S7KRH8_9FLAO|nr:S8/S53 family peptidase [Aureitalea marina]PQB05232.1 hypothetical protein BST85_10315 [Aureitalea marina]
MKKTITLFISLFILVFGSAIAQTVSFQGNTYRMINNQWHMSGENGMDFPLVENTISIKIDQRATDDAITAFEQNNELTRLRKAITGWVDYQIAEGTDPFQKAQQLQGQQVVSQLEFPTIGYYTLIPDDALFPNSWHLMQDNDADIDIEEAWDVTTGDPSIAVAILDSGVDWIHQDLGMGEDSHSNIFLNPGEDAWADPNDPSTGNGIDDDGNGLIDDWKGWNFSNNWNDARQDQQGNQFFHGTHVSGIVAAKTNNDEGISGVAGGWNSEGAKLLPCAVGITGPNGSVLDDAILYAAEIGARQVQLSLTVGTSQAIIDAVELAYNDFGVIIVNASGNNGSTNSVGFPGNLENVWAIGATNQNDFRAGFSNHGPQLFISAPGVSIWSTQLVSGSDYGTSDGTSFASPIASGVIALMLSVNPDLTPEEVKEILKETADKVGGYDYDWNKDDPGHSRQLGYGRINAKAAVDMAAQTLGLASSNGLEGIILSPNPANDVLDLRLPVQMGDGVQIGITALNGQVVRDNIRPSRISGNTATLDVQDLSSGVYLIRVTSGGDSIVKKFVKN